VKKKLSQFITSTVVLILALLFVIKFGGPSLLRAYVQNGIGNCQKIPILCLSPESKITNPAIDEDFKKGLALYSFPKMQAYLPKGFNVVQEEKKEFYYTRDARKYSGPVIYLLYQDPGFFPELFPQLIKQGVTDNYIFISRIMAAETARIQNLTDAFFAIMKAIFTPNLGDQKNIKITKFVMPGYRGYITYNLEKQENYFNCDIIDNEGGFFKIYIKDREKKLDLNKVFTIISTAKKQE
jgi:hypothetical protein